jgi:hypothetical protein
VGINPFWKLSFIFKCLTDSVVLDDFKTALDRLRAFKITRLGSFAVDNEDNGRPLHPQSVNAWAGLHRSKDEEMPVPSPGGDELSDPRPWSHGKPDLSHVERAHPRNREMSQIDESSSEGDVVRNPSDSPILRPQASWLRDSPEGDYAQAMREVTRSSHSNEAHSDRGAGVGRAR